MKFSLVMATLGRYEEIILFLNSLEKQTYKNFELFIIDQNNNDKIETLCQSYSMDIRVIKSSLKGLSVNRNIGLECISGDIIAFPDDDCEYEPATLEKVKYFLSNNPLYDFYTCNTKEKDSNLSIISASLDSVNISVKNIMFTAISITIFLRASALQSFRFDERLGAGSDFGSGEESDLLFFLLKNKKKGFYHAQDYIFHPYRQETPEKAFQYGKGYGAIHKKSFIAYGFLRPVISFLYLMFKEAVKIIIYPYSKIRISSFQGRSYGFLHYKYKKLSNI